MSSYAFHKPAQELADYLLVKQQAVATRYQYSSVMAKARRAYLSYFGRYYKNSGDAAQLGQAGEQGEFTTMAANQLRNIVQHTMSLLISNRLSFDAQAESTDVDARNACLIANNLLDQLIYDGGIDTQIHRTLELGLMMGTSYLVVEWNPNAKLIGTDENGVPVYAGAPKVNSYSIFDVILEPFQDDDKKQDWMCLREIWNRWDLIELFPDMEEEIKALPQIKDLQWYDPYMTHDEDHVFLWKAYHRETPAMPQGRMTWFCDGDTVLQDGPNPYVHPSEPTPNGGMPIMCFRPSVVYGSAYGHSITFDVLPLQQALNILDSAIITNQETHAIQNIIAPRQSNIHSSDLAGGNRLIEYDVMEDAPNGGKPEVLQLCATPSEVFTYRKELISTIEILSGINSVLRGQPQASLISGTALALVATQANSFNTVLESNYTRLAEDAAHFLLYIVSRFQTTEELVSLIGKGKSNEIRRFKGSDLSPVRKVKVIMGNALARTTAGKVEIAEMLVKNGIVKTPEAVLEALQTGNITQTLDNTSAEVSYIKYENEQLLLAKPVIVSGMDNHPQHCLEHRTLTFNPEVRSNPRLLKSVLDHIQSHLDQFDNMAMGNPTLLALVMGTPLPMPTPNPETGVGQPPVAPNAAAPQGSEADQKALVNAVGESPEKQGPSEQTEGVAMRALNSAQNKLKQQ